MNLTICIYSRQRHEAIFDSGCALFRPSDLDSWKDVRIPLIGTIECALGKIVEGIIAHE